MRLSISSFHSKIVSQITPKNRGTSPVTTPPLQPLIFPHSARKYPDNENPSISVFNNPIFRQVGSKWRVVREEGITSGKEESGRESKSEYLGIRHANTPTE